jgi:hypothetical protein
MTNKPKQSILSKKPKQSILSKKLKKEIEIHEWHGDCLSTLVNKEKRFQEILEKVDEVYTYEILDDRSWDSLVFLEKSYEEKLNARCRLNTRREKEVRDRNILKNITKKTLPSLCGLNRSYKKITDKLSKIEKIKHKKAKENNRNDIIFEIKNKKHIEKGELSLLALQKYYSIKQTHVDEKMKEEALFSIGRMYGRWDSIKVNDPKMFIRNRTEKEREKVKVKVIKEKSLSNIENLAKVWGVVEYGEGTQWKKNYADDEVPELAQRSLSHLEELLKSYSD